MARTRKVLFPTDFSSCSKQALFHAVRFAREYRAELHVLHAIVLHEDDPHDPAHHFPDPERIRRILEELAEENMGSLVQGGAVPDVVLKLVQRRDISAAPPILEYAREEDVDLIVMGTHGRRGVRKWLLGSVANEVVRFAPCSVLTVRCKGDPVPVEPVNRILVPVDFSEYGREALRVACNIASTMGAAIQLLHVLSDGLVPPLYDLGALRLSDLQAGISNRVETSLQEQLAQVPNCEGITSSWAILEGHPGREIVEFSRDQGVDLIVIATHGLSGFKHFLLGSTTEKVIAGAECPVLVTKISGKSMLL